MNMILIKNLRNGQFMAQVHFQMRFYPPVGPEFLGNEKSTKKGKRKVQGVPQSQTAALPRPQEEEETDKSKQAQIEQTYEKH